MQVQKDVLIAGGVVVICVALVVVALVVTGGKHDKPVVDVASQSPPPIGGNDFPSSSQFGDSSSANPNPGFGNGGGFGNSSANGGFGSSSSSAFPASTSPLAPAPLPGGDPGSTALGGSPTLEPAPPFAPTPAPATTPVEQPATPVAGAKSGGGTHTVAKGETLGDISQAHFGTAKYWRKIVEANPGLDPVRLKLGQVIQIPTVDSAAAPAAAPGGAGTYTVQKGDSYYTIAKKELGSAGRWREIERLNNVSAEDLKVGTVLKLPAKQGAAAPGGAAPGGGTTHIVGKGETLGDISKQYFGTTSKWKAIVEANPGVRAENLKVGQSLVIPSVSGGAALGPAASSGNYTVKAGDTLESIAAAQLGKKSAWKQIAEANPGLKANALRVGQQIVVPGAAAASPAPAPAPQPGQPGPAPAPGFGPGPGFSPPAPGATPVPAPAPVPTFKDDPFYSPYDAKPAPTPAPGRPVSALAGAVPTT